MSWYCEAIVDAARRSLFLKNKKITGRGWQGDVSKIYLSPMLLLLANLSFPFFPRRKSDLFYIYININTPHTLGKAWVTLTVPRGCPQLGMCSWKMLWEFVGVGGCAGSIRAWPGFGFAFWVGVWFGPGAPGVALGGDPWPGLCIGGESLNASRAGDQLWKTSSLARGSAGHPQVPGLGWLGTPLCQGPPLPTASATPRAVSRQMLPWSSTSDPLSPTPFFLLFLFPSFPPIEHLSWKPTSKKFFFF